MPMATPNTPSRAASPRMSASTWAGVEPRERSTPNSRRCHTRHARMLLNTRNVPTSRLTMLKAVRFRRKAPRSCRACPVRSAGVAASTRPPSRPSMRSAKGAGSAPSTASTPMRCRTPAPPNRDWASAMSITRARRLPPAPQRWKFTSAPTWSVRTCSRSRTSTRSPTDHPMAAASSGVAATQPRRRVATPGSVSGGSPVSTSQKSGEGASRSMPRSRTKVSGRPSTAAVLSNTGQAPATPGVPRTSG